jgi:hypothetical protein
MAEGNGHRIFPHPARNLRPMAGFWGPGGGDRHGEGSISQRWRRCSTSGLGIAEFPRKTFYARLGFACRLP